MYFEHDFEYNSNIYSFMFEIYILPLDLMLYPLFRYLIKRVNSDNHVINDLIIDLI